MKRLAPAALVAASACLCPGALAAQDVSPMYLVYQEFVKASMIPEYEQAMGDYLGLLAAGPARNRIQFVTVDGPELGYSYVVPITGFSGIDEFRRASQASADFVGEEGWASLQTRLGAAVDHRTAQVIVLRPDLSYLPETVELNADLPFRKYHWYYAIPGEEDHLEQVAKDLVALYGSYGVEHGFRFYQVLLGQNLPTYVVVERAENAADYAARFESIRVSVGGSADALLGRAMAFTRRIDVMEGMVRPELSYPPFELISTGGRR